MGGGTSECAPYYRSKQLHHGPPHHDQHPKTPDPRGHAGGKNRSVRPPCTGNSSPGATAGARWVVPPASVLSLLLLLLLARGAAGARIAYVRSGCFLGLCIRFRVYAFHYFQPVSYEFVSFRLCRELLFCLYDR